MERRGIKRGKKGVGTIQATIISVIIIAIAFGILIIFLRYIPYKDMAAREACHDSVVLRSSQLFGNLVEPGKAVVPLKCETKYVTINTNDEEKIKRIIADEMYDCWWMLGEGKYDFFPESNSHKLGYGLTATPCVVCSVIKFEGPAKDVGNIDMLSYLNNHIVPGENMTYIDYFLGQKTILPAELNISQISTSQDYTILFMGIKGQRIMESLKNEAFAALGLGTTASASAIAIGGAGGIKVLWKAISKVGKFAIGHPLISSIVLASIGVSMAGTQIRHGYIAVHRCDGSREGCFSLILVPFEAGNITRSCSSIESIP